MKLCPSKFKKKKNVQKIFKETYTVSMVVFLNFNTTVTFGQKTICWWSYPVYDRKFSSITGLLLFNDSSTSPQSQQLQMSP